MKEYKAFYVLSHPGQAEKVMEIELNKLAKEGWTLHSYAQPDLGHISAICERDISCDISEPEIGKPPLTYERTLHTFSNVR